MEKNKKPFNMDERGKLVAYRVIAIMYFLTIMAMQGVIMYRQLALDQNIHAYEDFAIIFVVNVIFLISALLYFGAIPVQKLSLKAIAFIYFLIIVLGGLFTFLRYNVFGSADLTFAQLMNKFLIVMAVSGLLLLFFVIFTLLGKWRMNKELDDEK
jgi:hypothetical protein